MAFVWTAAAGSGGPGSAGEWAGGVVVFCGARGGRWEGGWALWQGFAVVRVATL